MGQRSPITTVSDPICTYRLLQWSIGRDSAEVVLTEAIFPDIGYSVITVTLLTTVYLHPAPCLGILRTDKVTSAPLSQCQVAARTSQCQVAARTFETQKPTLVPRRSIAFLINSCTLRRMSVP